VNSHFEDDMKNIYDSLDPILQGHQSEVNQGTLDMAPMLIPEIGDGYSGLQLQGINERDTISDFLDSAIIDTDNLLSDETGKEASNLGSDASKNVFVKGGGLCRGADVEVAQQQVRSTSLPYSLSIVILRLFVLSEHIHIHTADGLLIFSF